MLNSLRKKIRNVSLFHTAANQDRTNKSKLDEAIDDNAGAEILSHFEKEWVTIHEINENNAVQADLVAKTIDTIAKRIANDETNLGLITHILTSTKLTTNISNCVKQIESLYSTCEMIERDLIQLQDVIDRVEFEHMKKQHNFHLEQYELRKNESLDQYKTSLEEKYKITMENHELNKKKVSEERQKVFQEAFKSDLELYKSLGTIPKVELPKKQTSALLEEIQLDFDPNELDQFFEDNPAI